MKVRGFHANWARTGYRALGYGFCVSCPANDNRWPFAYRFPGGPLRTPR